MKIRIQSVKDCLLPSENILEDYPGLKELTLIKENDNIYTEEFSTIGECIDWLQSHNISSDFIVDSKSVSIYDDYFE